MLRPIRVVAPSVLIARRTRSGEDRVVPPRASASKSPFRRRVGYGGTSLTGSGGQLAAPLRPPAGEHATTTPRSHASQEAVFALPGALLGLVRLLCHQAVLDSTAVSDSKLAGLQTHETAGGCQPHAIGSWPGFAAADSTGASRRPSNLARTGSSDAHCLARKATVTLPRTPRAGCRFDGSPRAREEYDFGPLYPWRRRTGDWFIDGCEAGMARRPR